MRKEARISTAVWRNPSFTALPLACQGLYWMLLSQPDVSMCGVLPYLPARWAAMCGTEDVDKALTLLEEAGSVIVDRDTSEVLIRTFVKHDGVLRGPKTRAGMWKAWDSILSDRLRRVVLDQSAEYVNEAVKEGWISREDVESVSRSQPDTPSQNAPSDTPSDERPDTPSHRGFPRARASDLQPPPPPPTSDLAADAADVGATEPMPVKGPSLVDRMTAWAVAEGLDRPEERKPTATVRWLLTLVDDWLGNATHSHGARMALLGEWCVLAGSEQPSSEAWGHLARLVKAYGGVPTLEAMHEATTNGAGLDEQWRDDPRALTKYATSVLKSREEAA